MEQCMKTDDYEIGMVGLGAMGRNLLLNMADHLAMHKGSALKQLKSKQ
jgi:6-phosphogluconate dehydrogenase